LAQEEEIPCSKTALIFDQHLIRGRSWHIANSVSTPKLLQPGDNEMKKILIIAALSSSVIGPVARAHPTNVPYETRGECERAYAESSKGDRERLADAGIFESRGAAQRTFNETFRCEYDEEEDAWFIVRVNG
jgi:hypothetical protein